MDYPSHLFFMPSEIPEISRANEAHAKEALADQIRL